MWIFGRAEAANDAFDKLPVVTLSFEGDRGQGHEDKIEIRGYDAHEIAARLILFLNSQPMPTYPVEGDE